MRYAAERRNLDESIEELRQIPDGRNDIFAEAAGITAGSWYARMATHVGYELIGGATLILAGVAADSRSTMTSWSAARASATSVATSVGWGRARASGDRGAARRLVGSMRRQRIPQDSF